MTAGRFSSQSPPPAPTGLAWRHWAGIALIIAVAALALHLLGRVFICKCGTIRLWHGVVFSAENSQHLTDWYTPTHVLHGLVFYVGARYLLARWSLGARLLAATLIEAAWEVLENTDWIIERYRQATISLDYFGDSIVNSAFDIAAMVVGFMIAARAPVWACVVLFFAIELVLAWVIRDNLTLNIVMLVWPVEAIRVWQAGG